MTSTETSELYDPSEPATQPTIQPKPDEIFQLLQSISQFQQSSSQSPAPPPIFYPYYSYPMYPSYCMPSPPHPQPIVQEDSRFVQHVANQMCREYSRKGDCQYKDHCRWFHVKLPDRICYSFLLKNRCDGGGGSNSSCSFRHMSAQQLYDYVQLHHAEIIDQLKRRR